MIKIHYVDYIEMTNEQKIKKRRERIADMFRAARKARQWDQSKVSELTGLSVGTISNTERGVRSPRLDEVLELCDLYKIPRKQLIKD